MHIRNRKSPLELYNANSTMGGTTLGYAFEYTSIAMLIWLLVAIGKVSKPTLLLYLSLLAIHTTSKKDAKQCYGNVAVQMPSSHVSCRIYIAITRLNEMLKEVAFSPYP